MTQLKSAVIELKEEAGSAANSSERVTVETLRELLGGSPVLISFPLQSKKPPAKRNLRSCVTNDVERLEKGNIGVLLGANAGNIISIDLDTDEAAHQFKELNRAICQQTLISKGRDGCNFWFKITDTCPPFRKLKLEEKPVGELRSEDEKKNHWTVIQGRHPDEPYPPYTIINMRKALELSLDELGNLQWLNGEKLSSVWSAKGSSECYIEKEKPRNPDVRERERERACASAAIPEALIDEAINDFIPTAPHQTNSLQHKLCRRIKKLMLDYNAQQPDLNEIGKRWYIKSREYLRTELSMEDYVDEFLERFSVTRTPEGQYMKQAFQNSASRPIPPELNGYSEDHQRLAQLCEELASIQNEDGKFILSTVQIDELMGYGGDRMKAQRKLRGLIAANLIEKTQSGNLRYANKYRYLGRRSEV